VESFQSFDWFIPAGNKRMSTAVKKTETRLKLRRRIQTLSQQLSLLQDIEKTMQEGITEVSFTKQVQISDGPVVFKNWAGTVSCTPRNMHYPQTRDEILAIVKHAVENRESVRVVGLGHSCNDIATVDGNMISLVNHFTVSNIDREKQTVKVEAGIRIEDLNRKLDELGLALPQQLTITGVSLGGMLATGCHGTSERHQILSTMVLEMELITMTGEVLTLSRKQDPEIFLAALCGLGSIGIISTVTLQCVKKFNLLLEEKIMTFGMALTSMSQMKKQSEFFKILWYPHLDKCVAHSINKTNKAPLFFESNRFASLKNRLLEFLLFLSKFVPVIVPWINRLYFFLLHGNKTRIDNSPKILTMDCHMKQWVNEWAIPEKNVTIALTTLREFIKNENLKVHFPVEVRFAKEDDIYLSPSYGRDTCYIGIIMYRPYGYDVEYQKYFRGFDRIMLNLEGRPHWAKDFVVSPSEWPKMYPKWNQFWNIQSQLDPHKLMWNDYVFRLHNE
jgi:L-gulonolactone oxidase